MLVAEGCLAEGEAEDAIRIERKKEKVEKFLKYSAECGTLT